MARPSEVRDYLTSSTSSFISQLRSTSTVGVYTITVQLPNRGNSAHTTGNQTDGVRSWHARSFLDDSVLVRQVGGEDYCDFQLPLHWNALCAPFFTLSILLFLFGLDGDQPHPVPRSDAGVTPHCWNWKGYGIDYRGRILRSSQIPVHVDICACRHGMERRDTASFQGCCLTHR